jgi:ribosome modulation factor
MTTKALIAFERGQADYHRGLIICPFKDATKAEAWIDGWKTAQACYDLALAMGPVAARKARRAVGAA